MFPVPYSSIFRAINHDFLLDLMMLYARRLTTS